MALRIRQTAAPRGPRRIDRDRPLVLFDVDGTLLDAGDTIADAMAQAFAAAGQAPPERATIRQTIGLSAPEMVGVLGWGLPPDLRDRILSGYLFRYFGAALGEEELPLFEGACTALGRLHAGGVEMGIVSGKSRRSLDHMLEEMDGRHLFSTVQCADDNRSKPEPDMIRAALAETGVPASRAVMVGDTRYDMDAARRAGVRAIGVLWGYNDPATLLAHGATAIAEDFEHLRMLLEALPAERGARSGEVAPLR